MNLTQFQFDSFNQSKLKAQSKNITNRIPISPEKLPDKKNHQPNNHLNQDSTCFKANNT